MTELKAPPGTIVTRGRELLTLNWAGQWLAPGMDRPMPEPDLEGWTILQWGEGPTQPAPAADVDRNDPLFILWCASADAATSEDIDGQAYLQYQADAIARARKALLGRPETAECPGCFALIRPERSIAHGYWHDQQTGQWRRDHLGEE